MTTEKRYEAQRLYLVEGKTLSGSAILLPRTDAQNYARGVIVGLQLQLLSAALGDAVDDESDAAQWNGLLQVVTVADGLERERSNPAHYDDNTPGLNTIRGVPLLPDPVFTYWDLVQFGWSAAGFDAFRRACKLPEWATSRLVVCAAGLLECDWAVRSLAEDRGHFATYLIGQALTCLQMLEDANHRRGNGSSEAAGVEVLLRDAQRKQGLAGMQKRWAEQRRARDYVRNEWTNNRAKYSGTKLECARVLVPIVKEQFNIDNIRDRTIAEDWLKGL